MFNEIEDVDLDLETIYLQVIEDWRQDQAGVVAQFSAQVDQYLENSAIKDEVLARAKFAYCYLSPAERENHR
jgi:sporulation-control protein spo0M